MALVLSRDPHVHVAELKETAQVPGLIYETTQRQVIGYLIQGGNLSGLLALPASADVALAIYSVL